VRGATRWGRALGAAAALTAVAIAAWSRAQKQQVGTDFHVFWQAGYDFAHGLPLYQPLEGARHFIYPPFAAQVFQVLALLPLQAAAWLFYVASVGLLVYAARLSRDIVRQLEPTRRRGPLPMAMALLCSAAFVLDNLDHVQVNLLIFVLCLLGIWGFIRRHEVAAAGWLVAAAAIKVTPVFLMIWAVLRGTRKMLAAVGIFGVLALSLPMIQRGPSQGIADLTAYYQSFLQQFAAGTVVTSFRNQNLGGMIYRATTPMAGGDVPPYEYAYLESWVGAAPLIYRASVIAILAAFLIHLIRLRIDRQPIGALEVSSAFLISPLLSGLTWKGHLVTFLFVSYVFFSLDRRAMTKAERGVLAFAWVGIGVMGLGRDVVGGRLHHYFQGYSLFVWVMLLLFTLSLAWNRRQFTIVQPLASK
jgi:Glycosyltransferase family 87